MSLKFDVRRFEGGGYGCERCTHLLTMGKQGNADGWTCKGFPDGIPIGIRMGIDRHDEPYPTDLGYSYHCPADPVKDDDGKPCFVYWDWFGCSHVVETVKELPIYATPPNKKSTLGKV